MQDAQELLVLEAKAKRGLTEQEADRLKALRAQNEELARQAEIVTLLSLTHRSPDEEARLQVLIKESEQYKSRLAAARSTLTVEKEITDENKEQVAALQMAIKTRGRGDSELSDRELARKEAEIRKDIAAREINLAARPAMAFASPSDFLLNAQRSNLGQLLAEQALRSRVRRDYDFFGEEAAFARNPGLSEQRFRQILDGRGPSTSERLSSAVEKLERRLDRPIKAVVLNPGQAPAVGD